MNTVEPGDHLVCVENDVINVPPIVAEIIDSRLYVCSEVLPWDAAKHEHCQHHANGRSCDGVRVRGQELGSHFWCLSSFRPIHRPKFEWAAWAADSTRPPAVDPPVKAPPSPARINS